MPKRIGQGQAPLGKTYFREWRELFGLSQDQLAERLNTQKAAVSKMETGVSLYNQTTLEAWARALDITVTELLGPPPNEAEERSLFKLGLDEDEKRRTLEYAQFIIQNRAARRG